MTVPPKGHTKPLCRWVSSPMASSPQACGMWVRISWSDRISGDAVSCNNRRKPILARGPVGALRYAWLRARPYHQTNPTPTDLIALTHKAPYEGGLSEAKPTLWIVQLT